MTPWLQSKSVAFPPVDPAQFEAGCLRGPIKIPNSQRTWWLSWFENKPWKNVYFSFLILVASGLRTRAGVATVIQYACNSAYCLGRSGSLATALRTGIGASTPALTFPITREVQHVGISGETLVTVCTAPITHTACICEGSSTMLTH